LVNAEHFDPDKSETLSTELPRMHE